MKYLIIVPAIIAASVIALWLWLVHGPNPYQGWEEAYD